ncbi:hypothetical protein GCM10009830_23530 [Glycomyces endophyticus]|uniref:ABC transporter domain-containing protein n=1 Tax=Glycomyces endophyticus TaxID=480996 RepID=A0ABN2GSN4_9ACTN
MSDRSDEAGPVPETSAEATGEPEITAPAPEPAAEPDPDPTAVIERPREGAAVAPPPAAAPDRTAVLDRAADLEHPSGDPFLDARGLTAAGRQGAIFTDVSLTARPGQVVAVTGDGGDGRTSLLLALAGRFRLDAGTLTVDGQTRPGQIRRRFTIAQAGPPIGFAEYHTVASCIKETVAVSGGTATAANIHAWLDRLAVGVDSGDTFGFLPRIDQIRFAVACAAAARTPAVAVDDADTGLDVCGAERVFEALRTVADAGQLVIAACTRSSPPADTVVDLRGRHRPPEHHRDHRHERAGNGGHQ